jgi:hypothetical protein
VPDTPLDRLLAFGTVLTTAAIVAMVALNWDAFAGSTAEARIAAEQRSRQVGATPIAPPREEIARPPEAATTDSSPLARAPLRISATRSASWLEVRAGGADGEVLYFGLLERNDTATVSNFPAWVRLGAAEGVDVRFQGKRVEALPPSQDGVVQFLALPTGTREVPPER